MTDRRLGVALTIFAVAVTIANLSVGVRHVAAAEVAQQTVDYALVVTGNELLAGAFADAHTVFVTRTLQPLGFHCVGAMCVDDKKEDIKEALRFFRGKAAFVVVTGGLGPTDNDVTRESLSEFTGIELKEHPDVLAAIERRLNTPRDKLRANLRRQTTTPVRGTYLKALNGTAVGLVFELPDLIVVALPGPPRELQPMVRDELIPYLAKRYGARHPGSTLTLRFVGLGQSQITDTIKRHITLPTDLTTYSQFEGGRVDFTYALPHDTPQDREVLQKLKTDILEHLADNVYADDNTTLEQCVVKLLQRQDATLALAEVGSGGTLTAQLNAIDGADGVLAGEFAAGTDEKLRHLVRVPDDKWAATPPTARTQALAAAASEATGSRWAIAVSEPRRDANGVQQLEIALKRPDGRLESLTLPFRGASDSARQNLTTQLLDQLWRRLR